MRIGRAAADAGVNVQTLRYYERRGLLRAPQRSVSGYREYSPEAVQMVKFIKRAQELGFSLDEIGELLDLRAQGGAARRAQIRALAAAKAKDIESKIQGLLAMKQSLMRLVANCAAENTSACSCAILDSLE
jgi:Hg(II)-responsive transcriptional regulator